MDRDRIFRGVREFIKPQQVRVFLAESDLKTLSALDKYGTSYVLLGKDTNLDMITLGQSVMRLRERGLMENNGDSSNRLRYKTTSKGDLVKRALAGEPKTGHVWIQILPDAEMRELELKAYENQSQGETDLFVA